MINNFQMVSWANNATIYEVNIRQYTPEGTFVAFEKHLPRLQKMGISILWLMPITPIAQELRQGTLGSYYACSSYTKLNTEFGDEKDFRSLIEKAHQLNMKVIIDWVANHTGYGHEWSTNKDWYVLDENGNFTEENGWHDVIDLNYGNANMRNAMLNAMTYWITEFNIDGFRCDMAHLVPLNFWQQAREVCDNIKPLFWLAECDVNEYHQVFDVSYAWQWMHTTEKLMKDEATAHDIYSLLHNYSNTNVKKLFYTANHDENSWNGTEFEKYGNAANALAVFCFTWNGMSLLYSGQELPLLHRLKFFDKDEIVWTEKLAFENFYTTLIHLRKTAIISNGETFILPTVHNKLMCYLRRFESETIIVLLNFSNDARIKVTVEHDWIKGKFENVFSGLHFNFSEKEIFELQAFEYLVYKKVND